MKNMTYHITISVETLQIDNQCSLEKEFTKLIYMNPLTPLYLTINQVNSCDGCVHGTLT